MSNSFRTWSLVCWAALASAALVLSRHSSCETPPRGLLVKPHDAALAGANELHIVNGSLVMVGGKTIPYTFEVTSKGNGALEITNIIVHVYDSHDNGAIYQPALLRSIPIRNAAGLCVGLEFFGTLISTDERSGEWIARRPLHALCEYDTSTGRFVVRDDPMKIVILDDRPIDRRSCQ